MGPDLADAVEAFEREEDAAFGIGRARQAGVAGHGDDGGAVSRGKFHHRRHFARIGGADGGEGGAVVIAGPVVGEAGGIGPRQHMGGTEQGGEVGEEGHGAALGWTGD